MKVRSVVPLHVMQTPAKVIATVYQAEVEKDEYVFPYFFMSRGEKLSVHPHKLPDAVVIVAISDSQLVLVDEFRPAIGTREISFPAGLIDPEDYTGCHNVRDAVYKAAKREFKEETGMDLVGMESMSPLNLYSSAGITNESSTYVLGYAHGTPTSQLQDQGEDIRIIMANLDQLRQLMKQDLVFSRAAWPFLWCFDRMGIRF